MRRSRESIGHRWSRRRAAGALGALVGTGLLLWSIPSLACETQEWESGGKMTKWVNPDVENNKLEITVDYKKKDDEQTDLIRFIEMIGPKTWRYGDRVLIGGGHKKIAGDATSGKVKWTITKDDLPNLRQGSISSCDSCHDEDNFPALDEWPNDFNALTDAEFKDWLRDMRDHGYEQYIDVIKGSENVPIDKTLCFQTPEPAEDGKETEFFFGHYNRGPAGFYRLEFLLLDAPPDWSIFTVPPVGQPYFLQPETLQYGEIHILPVGPVLEGMQARVIVCAVDVDTEQCVETFSVRAIKDTTPPTVSPMVGELQGNLYRISLTGQDLPAFVASAKLFWTVNGDPEESDFMDVASSEEDPVEFEHFIGPLSGTTHISAYALVKDELGNETLTPVQQFSVFAPIPTVGEWALAAFGLLLLSAGTSMAVRRGRPAPAVA